MTLLWQVHVPVQLIPLVLCVLPSEFATLCPDALQVILCASFLREHMSEDGSYNSGTQTACLKEKSQTKMDGAPPTLLFSGRPLLPHNRALDDSDMLEETMAPHTHTHTHTEEERERER